MPADTLLEQIIATSGLSGVFARGAILRALQRGGADVAKLTPQEARKALPELERALSVFMPPTQVVTHMAAIRRLLG